jgi:hypothetical protein
MDLKFDGLYRMIELDAFSLPNIIEDIIKAKYILECLFKLKVSLTNHIHEVDMLLTANDLENL